jgi:hypothetical protein
METNRNTHINTAQLHTNLTMRSAVTQLHAQRSIICNPCNSNRGLNAQRINILQRLAAIKHLLRPAQRTRNNVKVASSVVATEICHSSHYVSSLVATEISHSHHYVSSLVATEICHSHHYVSSLVATEICHSSHYVSSLVATKICHSHHYVSSLVATEICQSHHYVSSLVATQICQSHHYVSSLVATQICQSHHYVSIYQTDQRHTEADSRSDRQKNSAWT